jgi:hypothetical protein
LLGGDGAHRLVFKGRKLGFELMQALQGVVPTCFERRGDQPVCWIDSFVATLRKLGLIARPLDPHAPLRADLAIPLFQVRQRFERELDRHRRDGADQAIGDGLIERR